MKDIGKCKKCPLIDSDYFVEGEGDLTKARLMIIKEAATKADIKNKKPVIDTFLVSLLNSLDTKNEEIYVTSAVKCWSGLGNKVISKSILCCKEGYLDEELSLYRGKKVVALGNTTAHSLFRRGRSLRGSKNNPSLIGHPQDIVPDKQTLFVWSPQTFIDRGGDKQVLLDIKRAIIWGLT